MSRDGRLLRKLLPAAALLLLAAAPALAAGATYVVYGADTTPAQRQELAQFFGVNGATAVDTVTTPEMVAALEGSGLPVAATDRSISSSALTCLNRGDGLTVSTQNITRLTPTVYANALVTAGMADGRVLIAAPPDNPVTGETALVGVLKAFPQCQAGKQPDAARVALAYKQIAWTAALAQPDGDINRASLMLMQAQQPVVAGQATDDAAISGAIDRASTAEGVTVRPDLRQPLVEFLKGYAGLDFGTYARGYAVDQVSPAEVRLTPAGAETASAAGGSAPAPQAATARHATDWWKWAIPLAVSLALLALVLFLATRRRHPGFILEPLPPNPAASRQSGDVAR